MSVVLVVDLKQRCTCSSTQFYDFRFNKVNKTSSEIHYFNCIYIFVLKKNPYSKMNT